MLGVKRMRKIGRITKQELRSIIVSPVAWVVFALYTAYLSYIYSAELAQLTQRQLAGLSWSFTHMLFGFPRRGVFQLLANALLLLVPLLTMGAISRERQNGTLKLLMASPATTYQIVLGKYFAIAVYLVALMLILVGFIIFSGFIIENFEYARVFSGVLGLYLLACAYAAIGVFISSLTHQQIVAAIATMALLGFFSILGEIGQRIPVLSDAVLWLSMNWRFYYFREGLIASEDVAYYLLLILMFLTFTYIVLESGRIRESGFRRLVKFLGVFAIVATLGWVTSLAGFTANADLTRRAEMTLTPDSREALASLAPGTDIFVLINVLARRVSEHKPSTRMVARRRYFEPYEREFGAFNFKYQYYYAEPEDRRALDRNPGVSFMSLEDLARQYAELNRMDFSKILSPEEADALYQTSLEGNSTFYLARNNGERAVIRVFNDPPYFPSESQISPALRSLIDGPARVAYVTGNDERSAFHRGGKNHEVAISNKLRRRALINHGFEIFELSLSAPVPASVDILVLAGPTAELAEEAVLNLRGYIATGKSLLVMGEPGAEAVLNEALSDVTGVRFEGFVAGNAGDGFPEEMVFPKLDEAAGRLEYERSFRDFHLPLVMSGAVSLEAVGDTGFTVTPLVSAVHEAAEPVSAMLGVALERQVSGKVQRIVLIGDADFMSTDVVRLAYPRVKMNSAFIHDVFDFLSGGVYPIDASRPYPIDLKSRLDLADIIYLRVLGFGVLPAVFILLGGMLLLSRRRA